MEKQFYRRNLPHWQIPEAVYFVTYRLYGSIPAAVIAQLRAEYEARIPILRSEAQMAFPERSSGVQQASNLIIGSEAQMAFPERNSGVQQASNFIIGSEAQMAFPERSSGVQQASNLIIGSEAQMAFPERSSGVQQALGPEQSSRKPKFQSAIYDEQKRHFARFDALLDQNPNGPYWLQKPEIAQINWDALLYYHQKLYCMYAFCIMSNHVHILFGTYQNSPPLQVIMQRLKRYTALQCNKVLGRTGQPFWESESYDHIVRDKEFDRILAYILNNPVKAKQVAVWEDWRWTYCAPELFLDVPRNSVPGRLR